MATETWELAVEDTHGAWEHCGDYHSFDDAVAAAKEWYPDVYQDDQAVAVFGLSCDPGSGHYEHRLEVGPDGSCVHLEGGAIVGTL
jgi:hypothetical protein